jgi:uncharacterized protein (UPF0335 family)
MAFFKVDMVMCIKNKFYEALCIYKLDNNEILTREEIMKNIKEDIEEYKAKGYYYKVLKMVFNLIITTRTERRASPKHYVLLRTM